MRRASRGSRPVVVLALGNGVGASSIMLDIMKKIMLNNPKQYSKFRTIPQNIEKILLKLTI